MVTWTLLTFLLKKKERTRVQTFSCVEALVFHWAFVEGAHWNECPSSPAARRVEEVKNLLLPEGTIQEGLNGLPHLGFSVREHKWGNQLIWNYQRTSMDIFDHARSMPDLASLPYFPHFMTRPLHVYLHVRMPLECGDNAHYYASI